MVRFVPPKTGRVERASYALPPGVPALQSDPDALRRLALAAGLVAAVVVATVAFTLGRDSGRPPPSPRQVPSPIPDEVVLDWALAVARGPWDQLLENRERFIDTVAVRGPHPVLWLGVERLANAALLDPSPEGRRLAGSVVDLLGRSAAPDGLRRLLDDLDRHVRLVPR